MIKAQHYIVRPGNKAVPLIAVDELPHHIRIENVPRIITSHKELAEMTYVGEIIHRHELYKVVDLNKDIGSSLGFARARATTQALSDSLKLEPDVVSIVNEDSIDPESGSKTVIDISNSAPEVNLDTPPATPESNTTVTSHSPTPATLEIQVSVPAGIRAPTPSPVISPIKPSTVQAAEFVPLSLQKKYFGINEYQPDPITPVRLHAIPSPPETPTRASTSQSTMPTSPSPPLATRAITRPALSASETAPFTSHQPLPPWKDTSHLTLKSIHGKKVYCSYWMSKGECSFAQQGCQFKHVMPDNLADLNALGYQDIPKWYRDKFGVGSLTAVPGSGAYMRGRSAGPLPTLVRDVVPSSRYQSSSSRRGGIGQTAARVNNGLRRKTGKVGGQRPQNLLDLDETEKKGLLGSRYAVLSPSCAVTENEGDSESELPGHRKFKKVSKKKIRRKSASDCEGEMIREMEERDGREAAEYAVIEAEYEKMKKMKQVEQKG